MWRAAVRKPKNDFQWVNAIKVELLLGSCLTSHDCYFFIKGWGWGEAEDYYKMKTLLSMIHADTIKKKEKRNWESSIKWETLSKASNLHKPLWKVSLVERSMVLYLIQDV